MLQPSLCGFPAQDKALNIFVVWQCGGDEDAVLRKPMPPALANNLNAGTVSVALLQDVKTRRQSASKRLLGAHNGERDRTATEHRLSPTASRTRLLVDAPDEHNLPQDWCAAREAASSATGAKLAQMQTRERTYRF